MALFNRLGRSLSRSGFPLQANRSFGAVATATKTKAPAAASASSGFIQPLLSYPVTQVSKLDNGIRVATEAGPGETATVGVWIDTGSRYEAPQVNGVAHFLEHMVFKGTGKRTKKDIETEIENMGAHLNAYTSREQTVFYAKCFKKDVPQCMDLLADVLKNSKFDEAFVNAERDTILREMESVNENFEEVIFDKLHETAFRGNALGRTILGPVENIQRITKQDIQDYIKTHYVGNRMVVAAAGAVNHGDVVNFSQKLFGDIPSVSAGKQPFMEPAVFTGSDIKIQFDNMKWVYWAMAYPTAGWNDPDNVPLLVLQTMLGAFDKSVTAATGEHSSSYLVAEAAGDDLVERFHTFNTQYSDTGLFGFYAQIQPTRVEHFIMSAMRELTRAAHQVDPARLEEAKNQLKMNLLAHLDGSTTICEDIGRQMITYGRRLHPLEYVARIDAVDPKAIKAAARRYFVDRDHAMASLGCTVEVFPGYNFFRDSSWWRTA